MDGQPPAAYEVRVRRLDEGRCQVTFLDPALPASAARLLPLEERLACQAVVYIAGAAHQLCAEATYRRPPDRLRLPPDHFPRRALALAREFLRH